MKQRNQAISKVLVAFAFALTGHAVQADEARSLAREGVKAYEKQDYEAAIKAFRRAAELNPDALDYQFNLGTALSQRAQFEEAEVALRKAMATEDEPTPDAAYNLAYSIAQSATSSETPVDPKVQVQKLREAVDGFRRAVIANPKDRDAKYNLETSRLILRELEKQMQQQQQQGEDGQEKEGENQDKQDGQNGQQGGDQQDQQNQGQEGEQEGEDQKSQDGEQGNPEDQKQEGQEGQQEGPQQGQQEGLEREGQPQDKKDGKHESESEQQKKDQEQKEGMEQQKSEAGNASPGGSSTEGEAQEGQPTEEQLDALRVLNSLAEAKPEQFKKLFQFKGQRQRKEKDW